MNELKTLLAKYKQFLMGVFFTLLLFSAFSLIRGHKGHRGHQKKHDNHGKCERECCEKYANKASIKTDSIKTK